VKNSTTVFVKAGFFVQTINEGHSVFFCSSVGIFFRPREKRLKNRRHLPDRDKDVFLEESV